MTVRTPMAVVNKDEFAAFVTAPTTADRLSKLVKWRSEGLTLDSELLSGLMRLPVSHEEIIVGFEICSTQRKELFELWVMNNLLTWNQNIAGVAIQTWARITDRILWHRLIPISSIPGLPQRIRYTILDAGLFSHGYEITRSTLESPSWEDLSTAFHALLFERALQFDLKSDRLTKLAWTILKQNSKTVHPEDKSLISAIGWLCRHEEKPLLKWSQNAPCTMWTDLLRSALETHGRRSAEISKLEKSRTKSSEASNWTPKLPALWSRDEINDSIFASIVKSAKNEGSNIDGFPQSVVRSTECLGMAHPSWIDTIIRQLPYGESAQMIKEFNSPFTSSYNVSKFSLLHSARSLAVTGKLGIATDVITSSTEFSESTLPDPTKQYSIEDFFDALDNKITQAEGDQTVWSQLAHAWNSPTNADLNALAFATRKNKGLCVLAHIMVLSRMKGRDEAVLKLLDYVRSNEEIELRAVVRALGQINTSRSLLELIAMLTRPNATVTVQQDIVAVLHGKDLKGLQKELRSAVHDLSLPQNTEHPIYQIKDELSGMLVTVDGLYPEVQNSGSSKSPTSKDGNLDHELAGMIPHYNALSSEVKRALRTALFFNKTVVTSQHANAIDLSPLIDMQYKAMELLYREFFEDAVSQSLQKGMIQRKLDVIGYARPIMRNMDEFESYIASLPVVKDIPFFSKFKLRKMLRAICQFQPGKRFTLDGLKAFGLYFIVFGRQSCKHGLAGFFNVGAKDDLELAELCKELHIFQDFRNRAAHEGFHPDASNDIMGIWRTTALAVQWAFRAKNAQKTNNIASEKSAS